MTVAKASCRQPGAWIPWVLALVALFGLNGVCGLCRDDSPARRGKGGGDGVVLSLDAKDPDGVGGVSDPLVSGPPVAVGAGAFLSPGAVFVPVESRREVAVAAPRRGAIRGRAPPVVA